MSQFFHLADSRAESCTAKEFESESLAQCKILTEFCPRAKIDANDIKNAAGGACASATPVILAGAEGFATQLQTDASARLAPALFHPRQTTIECTSESKRTLRDMRGANRPVVRRSYSGPRQLNGQLKIGLPNTGRIDSDSQIGGK
ncbi:MAG: hypothetical protein IPP17_11490 [Bacteroidetes bacterium]|nr:hypothetical protein [Bacteroidota bacterium]